MPHGRQFSGLMIVFWLKLWRRWIIRPPEAMVRKYPVPPIPWTEWADNVGLALGRGIATGVLPSGSSHSESIISIRWAKNQVISRILRFRTWVLHSGGAEGFVWGSVKLRLRFLGVLSSSCVDGCDSMIEVAVIGPSLGTVTVVVATRRSCVEISIFFYPRSNESAWNNRNYGRVLRITSRLDLRRLELSRLFSNASEARFIRAARLERTMDSSSSSSVRSVVMSKDASIEPVLSSSFIVFRRSPGDSNPRE